MARFVHYGFYINVEALEVLLISIYSLNKIIRLFLTKMMTI